jgi:chaperonin cofactor prefoldin
MVKEHLTTLNGKGYDFELSDYLSIAKKNLIAKERAIIIVQEVVEVLDGLEERAERVGLSVENITECWEHVNGQLKKIKREL